MSHKISVKRTTHHTAHLAAGPSMGAGSSLFTGSGARRASSTEDGARSRPIAVYKPSPALNLDAAAPCQVVVTRTKRPPPGQPKERARQHGEEELRSAALIGNGHKAALLPRQDSNVSSTSRASTARSPTSSP